MKIKNLMKSLATILATIFLTGCIFSTPAAIVKPVVDDYCKKPLAERQLAREAVGLAVHPNRIKIDCADDEEES